MVASPKKALLFGFLVWLVTFLAAFALFPVRVANRPLFESLIPVVLAAVTVLFAGRYFRHVEATAAEGLRVGIAWLGLSVLIDLPLMLAPGPMQMTLSGYAADIAVTYLMIPVITAGMGWRRGQRPA